MSEDVDYHRVASRFWNDPKVRGWHEDARVLALYLLTSPHRATEGLFLLRRVYVAADLQWETHRLETAWRVLEDDRWILWDPSNEVVMIASALRYQRPNNENAAKGAMKRIKQIPAESPLVASFHTEAQRVLTNLPAQAKGRQGMECLVRLLDEWLGAPVQESLPIPVPNPS